MQRSCWLEVQEVQKVQGSGAAVQKVQKVQEVQGSGAAGSDVQK